MKICHILPNISLDKQKKERTCPSGQPDRPDRTKDGLRDIGIIKEIFKKNYNNIDILKENKIGMSGHFGE